MKAWFSWALTFFVLGFMCVLFLDGGKQFALSVISFVTSFIIALVTLFIYKVR